MEEIEPELRRAVDDGVAANEEAPDFETRLTDEDHESLRLWLRLLTCATLIERRVRASLRAQFAITLPRFDLMAQLERHPEGLRMGELTRRLMVTGGNVTGLTDQLVAEGLVERQPIPGDRRAHAVRLTAKGKAAFDAMARAHEGWVIGMLAVLQPAERARLHGLLGALKSGLQSLEREHRQDAPAPAPASAPARRRGRSVPRDGPSGPR